MTYILEMASGKECPGEDLYCPSDVSTHGAPPAGTVAHRPPALQLALTEALPTGAPSFPAALYMDAMIGKLED